MEDVHRRVGAPPRRLARRLRLRARYTGL